MKAYSFKLGISILGKSEADARKNLRKEYNIPDNVPDEYIERAELHD